VLTWLIQYSAALSSFFPQQRISDEQVKDDTPSQAKDWIRLPASMRQGDRDFTLLAPLAPVKTSLFVSVG
jgi:hypothetical protein